MQKYCTMDELSWSQICVGKLFYKSFRMRAFRRWGLWFDARNIKLTTGRESTSQNQNSTYLNQYGKTQETEGRYWQPPEASTLSRYSIPLIHLWNMRNININRKTESAAFSPAAGAEQTPQPLLEAVRGLRDHGAFPDMTRRI